MNSSAGWWHGHVTLDLVTAASDAGLPRIAIRAQEGSTSISIAGRLDEVAASRLRQVPELLRAPAARGLDVRLEDVTGHNAAGVQAVAACLVAGRGLPDGVRVSVATGAGREALLATLAEI
jgi:hypothetical protein